MALEVVPWHIRVEPEVVRPGARARLVFQARLDESADGPWRMYAVGSPRPSRAVAITIDEPGKEFTLGSEVQQWGEKSRHDPWFDTTVVYFERQALLWMDIRTGGDVIDGTGMVHGKIEFMVCNDRICLPPAVRRFSTTVAVKRGATSVLPSAPPMYDPALMPNADNSLPSLPGY